MLYDCASCAQRPFLRAQLGHDGPPTSFYTDNLLSNEPLERCPLRTLQLADEAGGAGRSLAREVERHADVYFPAYRNGHLLVAGGVADQPARYLELMGMIGAMESRVQEKYAEIRAATPPGSG